tara:strand:+ start:2126 stop:3487 length:1362 start_codon:yes stop_codon:yes gene_type:complete
MSLIHSFVSQNTALVSSVGLEEFTDGEKKLDVYVSSEPSVDEVVGEVAKCHLEQTEIARDGEHVREGIAAMEQYAALLDRGIENGGLPTEAILGMSVGIEGYQRLLEGENAEPIIPSLEAFGGSGSKLEGAKDLAKKIWEWLKKAWDVSGRILKQLINKFKDMTVRSQVAIRKMATRAGELSAKASSLAASGATLSDDKKTLKVNNASKLMVANTFKGSDFDLTTDIVKALCVQIPVNLTDFVINVTKAVNGYKPGDDSLPDVDFGNAFSKAFSENVKGDSRFNDKKVIVKRTFVFPGNQAAYVTYPNAAEGDKMLSGQKLNILNVPGSKTENGSEQEITVRTPGELKTDAERIGKILKIALRNATVLDVLANRYKDLDEAGAKIKTNLKDKELDEGDRANLKELQGLVDAATAMNSGVSGGMSYVLNLINAQLSLVEKQLAQYGAKEEKEDK